MSTQQGITAHIRHHFDSITTIFLGMLQMSSANRKRTWIGITSLALILGSWALWTNSQHNPSLLKAQAPAVAEPKAAAPVAPPHDPAQALTDYVNKADESYKWSVRQRWTSGKSRGLELALQSQTWQGGTWKHQLFLYCPANAQPQTNAICMIDGGSWKDEYTAPIPAGQEPTIPNSLKHFAQAAEILNCPIVVIRQVPHQPLFNNMYEDAIISHTFMQYVKTGEPEWPLLLPMVKSVLRALDSAQLAAKAEWQVDLQKFVLSGASKRGWTTWLTATHDPRIIGIAPMVIDVLNFGPQMAQQLSYYGKFSERIHDYTDKGLPRVMLTAAGKNLLRIVDPFEYREKLRLPKFIILGTNDPY
jgi:PhoPQ-activated pathogenicity-related protein